MHAGVAPHGISDERVVGGSRTAPTGRPGTPHHTPGMHAGVARRDISDARVVGGSRTAPTVRPGTPHHTPGIHAGAASRDIPDARVVGGSRTAPTVRPGTPWHTPGCTQVPRAATSPTHGSWAVHEPPLRAGLARLRGHHPHPTLASPAPCCTISYVAFTDPLHSLTYCYA